MQFTVSAITLLAAVATVQASCIPILTCSRKRDISHPHARDVVQRAAPTDFSDKFTKCLDADKAAIKPAADGKSYIISGANGDNAFHTCHPDVVEYQTAPGGMKDGLLVTETDGSFTFTPTEADLPEWKEAVGTGKGARSISLAERAVEYAGENFE